jgi:hypothetical protein
MRFLFEMLLKSKLLFTLFYLTSWSILFGQNLVWEKTFFEQGGSQHIKDLSFVGSEIYMVGENSAVAGGLSYLIKADSLGSPIWKKSIFDSACCNSFVTRIIKVPGLPIFRIFGKKDTIGPGFDSDYMVTYDSSGNLLSTLKFPATSSQTSFSAAKMLRDGTIITAGTKQNFGTSFDVIVKRFTVNGTVAWEREYPLNGFQDADDIQEMYDGSIMISGRGVDHGILYRIGLDGSLIATYMTPTFAATNYRQEIALDTSGNVFVFGTNSNEGYVHQFINNSFLPANTVGQGISLMEPLSNSNFIGAYYNSSIVGYLFEYNAVFDSSIWEFQIFGGTLPKYSVFRIFASDSNYYMVGGKENKKSN